MTPRISRQLFMIGGGGDFGNTLEGLVVLIVSLVSPRLASLREQIVMQVEGIKVIRRPAAHRAEWGANKGTEEELRGVQFVSNFV